MVADVGQHVPFCVLVVLSVYFVPSLLLAACFASKTRLLRQVFWLLILQPLLFFKIILVVSVDFIALFDFG